MTSFFEIENIAFEVWSYQVSWTEFLGVTFGLLAVWFASRANIWTWATGIGNIFFMTILFYKVQLYADMFLQIYYLAVTLYGWYHWNRKTVDNESSIKILNAKNRLISLGIIAVGTVIFGFFFSNIHSWMPTLFPQKAAFPYADSFIMTGSIVAQFLLARKRLENWHLWIAIDVFATFIYYKKGVLFLSAEYLIFLGLAVYGLLNWRREMQKSEAKTSA